MYRSGIVEHQNLVFIVNSATARYIPFWCMGPDGKTPRPGLTFTGADLMTSKNMVTFQDFTGAVVADYGDGNYLYRTGDDEIDTAARFSLKVARSDIYPGIFVATIASGSVPVVPGSGGQVGGFGFMEGWFRF